MPALLPYLFTMAGAFALASLARDLARVPAIRRGLRAAIERL